MSERENYFGEHPTDAACVGYVRSLGYTPTKLGSLVYLNSTNWNLRLFKNGTWYDLTNPVDTDKVSVDAAATPDYIGAGSADGVLRVDATMSYIDGGDFVTLGVDETQLNHDALIGVANSTAHTLFLLLDGTRPMTGNLDLDGNKLILDSDGDTTIHANTSDDVIEFDIGGATTYYQFSQAVFEIFAANPIYFYNAGGTEYGQIYRNDDYLYIVPDTGAALGLCEAANVVAYYTSNGIEVQSGYVQRFYNAGNTEYGYIYRDDDYLYIDSGTGGETKFYIAGVDVGYLTAGSLRYQEAAASFTQYLDVYSTTNTDMPRCFFRKSAHDTLGTKNQTDNGDQLGAIYFQGVDAGSNFDTGAYIIAIQNGVADTRVPTDLHFVTYTDTTGTAWFKIKTDGDIEVTTGTGIEFYNAGNSESGAIYRDDNYLRIDSGTGGNLLLQVSGVWISLLTTAGLYMRGGKIGYFNNAGNTESGLIYRDDNNFIWTPGTGGNSKIIMDADADSYFITPSDDQVDLYIGGSLHTSWTSSVMGIQDGFGLRKLAAMSSYMTLETIDEEITISIGNTWGDSTLDLLSENSIIMFVQGIVTQKDSDDVPGQWAVGTAANTNRFRNLGGAPPAVDDEFINSRDGDGTDAGPFYNVSDTKIRAIVDIAPTGTDVKVHVIVYYWEVIPVPPA